MTTTTAADVLRQAADRAHEIGDALHRPLAKWLHLEARRLTATTHPDWQATVAAPALAVARQILGTTGHRPPCANGDRCGEPAHCPPENPANRVCGCGQQHEATPVPGESPLSPFFEHPACGFHWHGRDGMDIPMRDGQPVCPRCELRRLAAEAQQPTPAVVCVHPEGYEGECPCPPSCVCCQPTPAVAEETK